MLFSAPLGVQVQCRQAGIASHRDPISAKMRVKSCMGLLELLFVAETLQLVLKAERPFTYGVT
jgi:hypothetical protein